MYLPSAMPLPLAVSISEAKVLFLMFWSVAMVDLKQQRNWVCACLETIETHQLERPLSKSRDRRFLAGRLYLNNEVFSCAMMLLIVFLSKTINFFNVNITYVYITEFTLAKPM